MRTIRHWLRQQYEMIRFDYEIKALLAGMIFGSIITLLVVIGVQLHSLQRLVESIHVP